MDFLRRSTVTSGILLWSWRSFPRWSRERSDCVVVLTSGKTNSFRLPKLTALFAKGGISECRRSLPCVEKLYRSAELVPEPFLRRLWIRALSATIPAGFHERFGTGLFSASVLNTTWMPARRFRSAMLQVGTFSFAVGLLKVFMAVPVSMWPSMALFASGRIHWRLPLQIENPPEKNQPMGGDVADYWLVGNVV